MWRSKLKIWRLKLREAFKKRKDLKETGSKEHEDSTTRAISSSAISSRCMTLSHTKQKVKISDIPFGIRGYTTDDNSFQKNATPLSDEWPGAIESVGEGSTESIGSSFSDENGGNDALGIKAYTADEDLSTVEPMTENESYKLENVNVEAASSNKHGDGLNDKSCLSVLPTNATPFSDEWPDAIEAAGEGSTGKTESTIENGGNDALGIKAADGQIDSFATRPSSTEPVIDNYVSWVTPEAPMLKLNVDACFMKEESRCSVGGLFRDSEGKVLDVFLGMLAAEVEVKTAATGEYWAVVEGIRSAVRKGRMNLAVESDSAEVAGSFVDYFKDPAAFEEKLKPKKGGEQTIYQKSRLECLSLVYKIVKSNEMSVRFAHVPGGANRPAHFLANLGYHLGSGVKDFAKLSEIEFGTSAESICLDDAKGVKFHKKSKPKLPWKKDAKADPPLKE